MGPDNYSGGNTIVIELGTDRGEPDTYDRPTRSTTAPWFAPMLVALLVLVCGTASAAPPAPPLSPVLSLQVGPADSYALTEGDALLAQTLGTLKAYSLADGQLRWTVGTTAPTYRLRTGGDLVLLRPWSVSPGDPHTTALSLTDGTARWQHEGSVVTVAGSDALLATSSVRGSGPARRVQGPIESLDPATGRSRWRVDVPSTAVLLAVPGSGDAAPRMLLVHDNRTATLHDLSDGRQLATTSLPPANYGTDNPTITGGVILLRHPGTYGPEVSAYDPATLRQRWVRPAGGAYEIRTCGALACLAGPEGVRAIDPATGDEVWFRPGWRNVEQRGSLLLAFSSPAGAADPIGLVEAATGRVLVDLVGWRPVAGAANSDHVLVTRVVDAGARTMIAIARPGSVHPELLSDLPPGTGDCQAVPNRLVCRSATGELNVWAYHRR